VSQTQQIALPGTLDTVAAAALRETLLAARGAPLTLDGASTQRFGGAALQILLSARRQWQADGNAWKIAQPSAALREALGLMGASHLVAEDTDV
jgi:chemotaxis protein CheX